MFRLGWTSSKLRTFKTGPVKKHLKADSCVLWCTICCHCQLSIFVLFVCLLWIYSFQYEGCFHFHHESCIFSCPREHPKEKWHCALFHDKISSATYQIRQFGTSLPCIHLFSIKKQHKLSFQNDKNNKYTSYINKYIYNNNNNKCQFIESCGKSG